MLRSTVAEMANCAPAGRPDGILAALFLERFTGGLPSARIDIAGVAWNEVDVGIRGQDRAGFGARLLVAFLEAEAARA